MPFDHITSAALTDPGRKRSNNEDSVLELREAGFFCVADGMGGGREGQVASQAVTTALSVEFNNLLTEGRKLDLGAKTKLIKKTLNEASLWIKERAEEKGYDSMGSTVVVLVLDDYVPSRGMAVHAGDSALYLFRRNRLKRLTREHSISAETGIKMEKLPQMFRNVITRAVGLKGQVDADETPLEVMQDDVLLLCSDGLNRMVPDKLLAKTLAETVGTPSDLVRVLVDKANEAGGSDNISVVLVRVGALPSPLPVDASVAAAKANETDYLPETGDTRTNDTMTLDPDNAYAAGKPTPPVSDTSSSDGDTLEGLTPRERMEVPGKRIVPDREQDAPDALDTNVDHDRERINKEDVSDHVGGADKRPPWRFWAVMLAVVVCGVGGGVGLFARKPPDGNTPPHVAPVLPVNVPQTGSADPGQLQGPVRQEAPVGVEQESERLRVLEEQRRADDRKRLEQERAAAEEKKRKEGIREAEQKQAEERAKQDARARREQEEARLKAERESELKRQEVARQAAEKKEDARLAAEKVQQEKARLENERKQAEERAEREKLAREEKARQDAINAREEAVSKLHVAQETGQWGGFDAWLTKTGFDRQILITNAQDRVVMEQWLQVWRDARQSPVAAHQRLTRMEQDLYRIDNPSGVVPTREKWPTDPDAAADMYTYRIEVVRTGLLAVVDQRISSIELDFDVYGVKPEASMSNLCEFADSGGAGLQAQVEAMGKLRKEKDALASCLSSCRASPANLGESVRQVSGLVGGMAIRSETVWSWVVAKVKGLGQQMSFRCANENDPKKLDILYSMVTCQRGAALTLTRCDDAKKQETRAAVSGVLRALESYFGRPEITGR